MSMNILTARDSLCVCVCMLQREREGERESCTSGVGETASHIWLALSEVQPSHEEKL